MNGMVKRVYLSVKAWEQAKQELPLKVNGKRKYNKGNQAERVYGIEWGNSADSGMPHPDPADGEVPDIVTKSGQRVEVKALQATVHKGVGIAFTARYVLHALAQGKNFVYVVYDGDAYEMDPITFFQFVMEFRKVDHDSRSKAAKTRLLVNQRMVQWLEDRRTA